MSECNFKTTILEGEFIRLFVEAVDVMGNNANDSLFMGVNKSPQRFVERKLASVTRISIMSIIARDFNDLESFLQPLAAILENGYHSHQRWPNIHLCSKDIYQHICQIWCLYHKMNNLIC